MAAGREEELQKLLTAAVRKSELDRVRSLVECRSLAQESLDNLARIMEISESKGITLPPAQLSMHKEEYADARKNLARCSDKMVSLARSETRALKMVAFIEEKIKSIQDEMVKEVKTVEATKLFYGTDDEEAGK